MAAVDRVPVSLRYGWAPCFRRTAYDTTIATCRAVLRSHRGFGSLDFSRIGSAAVAYVIASLFELGELGAHLCTGDRPVRLSERYGRRDQGRSESDGGNWGLGHAGTSSGGPRRASVWCPPMVCGAMG